MRPVLQNAKVEGWSRLPPFAVLLQLQRKGKNKQDIIDSHCLLCADLKLSDLPNYYPAGNALKTFRKTAPTLQDLAEETQNTVHPPTSSDELYSFSLSLQNMSGPFINKLLSGDEQCKQNKLPSVFHYHPKPCHMLKEKRVAFSIRSVNVLPPVRESRNLRSNSVFKRAQSTDWYQAEVTKPMMPRSTEAVTASDTGNAVEVLTNFITGENSYRFKGSPNTKHWLSQDSTQELPTFNITFQNKYELPSSTVGRNLRQEELTRPSTRNNTRLHSGHKTRDLKRPEAHRLMLIGTTVRMPV
ncbi:uncharacterized protein si:ch73-103b9.2 isoform X2 [Pimephales promelas]|uniref:uncharacterized protein si:ch73-103b9.2 isoform X2 n=1 Tax=Pimephales promelas TaxID=90988 RepID=UPI001955B97C|nr:uncharacterized protein si:ch73-103b9.2 isoform X2 [Pimephales promelas]KAG1946517.1 hypothetical protein F2P79_013394 [Pimephales promelas]